MPEEIAEEESLRWLTQRGRFVNVTFLLRKGAVDHLITIRDGAVTEINSHPKPMPRWTFALIADDDAWERFWSATPEPKFHDLLALAKFKRLEIIGDQAIFMSNLLYFKELIAHLGGQLNARKV